MASITPMPVTRRDFSPYTVPEGHSVRGIYIDEVTFEGFVEIQGVSADGRVRFKLQLPRSAWRAPLVKLANGMLDEMDPIKAEKPAKLSLLKRA
jgi:hypothetical protein